jgi:hypothetical protein
MHREPCGKRSRGSRTRVFVLYSGGHTEIFACRAGVTWSLLLLSLDENPDEVNVATLWTIALLTSYELTYLTPVQETTFIEHFVICTLILLISRWRKARGRF